MRPEGWESMLAGHIEEAKEKTFAWGTHDCILWCADWVKKLTGEDLATDYRGQYESEEQAAGVIAAMGFDSLPQLVDHHLASVPVKRAQRGDIMLHPMGMLGICGGAYAYFVTENGITKISFTLCHKAWRV